MSIGCLSSMVDSVSVVDSDSVKVLYLGRARVAPLLPGGLSVRDPP